MNKYKINKVFSEAELDKEATVANFATVLMNSVYKDFLLTNQFISV